MTVYEYDVLNYIRLKGSMEKGTVYSSFPFEQRLNVRAAINVCVSEGLLCWSSPVLRSGVLSLTDKGRLALIAEDERRAALKENQIKQSEPDHGLRLEQVNPDRAQLVHLITRILGLIKSLSDLLRSL